MSSDRDRKRELIRESTTYLIVENTKEEMSGQVLPLTGDVYTLVGTSNHHRICSNGPGLFYRSGGDSLSFLNELTNQIIAWWFVSLCLYRQKICKYEAFM